LGGEDVERAHSTIEVADAQAIEDS